MKILIEKDYKSLSEKAARDLVNLLGEKKEPLLCVPSGDSPVGLYQHLVQLKQGKEIDTSGWRFISLDEWMGMNANDAGSCTYYLNKQLLAPLQVDPEKTFLFDGKADAQKQCEQMEQFIQQYGGIDVAILGLGLNGHIGMNEPGTSPSQRSHISDIDPLTQQVGQKYFDEPKQISQGLTLGLATLLEAKHIMLLVSGEKKAAIVQKVLEGAISESVPASLLKNHPSIFVYLDKEASQSLTSSPV